VPGAYKRKERKALKKKVFVEEGTFYSVIARSKKKGGLIRRGKKRSPVIRKIHIEKKTDTHYYKQKRDS